MESRATFSPASRMHTHREFETARRRGSSSRGRFVVLYEVRREGAGDPGPRLGVAVSKGVGCAVERNRVKRYIREAFRTRRGAFPPGTDLLVVARFAAADASYAQIERELLDLHGRIRAV